MDIPAISCFDKDNPQSAWYDEVWKSLPNRGWHPRKRSACYLENLGE